MKKTLIACLMFFIILPSISFADDLEAEEIDIEQIKDEVLVSSGNVTSEPSINSKAAIVFDRDTKCILYSKNANEKRAMASTTKIMTAIIALENYNLEEVITVSKKAASVGGSRLGLTVGDKITMNDLIYGLMLRSRKRCSSPNSSNYRWWI